MGKDLHDVGSELISLDGKLCGADPSRIVGSSVSEIHFLQIRLPNPDILRLSDRKCSSTPSIWSVVRLQFLLIYEDLQQSSQTKVTASARCPILSRSPSPGVTFVAPFPQRGVTWVALLASESAGTTLLSTDRPATGVTRRGDQSTRAAPGCRWRPVQRAAPHRTACNTGRSGRLRKYRPDPPDLNPRGGPKCSRQSSSWLPSSWLSAVSSWW